jgi:hypothetical protein
MAAGWLVQGASVSFTLGYLEKLSFCPISSLCSINYPRHIQDMPAVIFFACLDLAQKSLFFKGAFIKNDEKISFCIFY